MSKRAKIILAVAIPSVLLILLGIIFGSEGQNTEYKPQNEFRLDSWVSLPGPLDINKAVLYLFFASVLTIVTMLWIANRMKAKPNRVQTAVEVAYSLMRDNIAGGNMDGRMARKWFSFVGTLFLFIWWSNMIGYIPLPTNSEETFSLFGFNIPSFALYAATANISVPLTLTLVVWFSYHYEGIRAKGVIGYLKSWIPAGVEGAARIPIFVIEVISHFVRIISLSVRLFANILAGHLLILFMAGGLVALLGIAGVGIITLPAAVVFFLFAGGPIAALPAFLFAPLPPLYLGGAGAPEHSKSKP